MTQEMDYPQIQIFEVKEFEPEEDFTPQMHEANIKVIGAGGGGSNAVNCMIKAGLTGVEFIAINTDVQHLMNKSNAKYKLQIGSKHTRGLGAGGKPNVGEDAAKEDHEKITDILRGADMVFITAGMGGGTGTGSAPIIAKIAKANGALTVAVVTKPFSFEGAKKMEYAEEGIRRLREEVDTLIVIPNQNLLKMADSKTTTPQALALADDILRQGVQSISDIITKTGIINIDCADVKSTMEGQGDALMGIGTGEGDNRAKDAANKAIDNPLLEDTAIDGATRILVNISGPENIGIHEIDSIVNIIKTKADPGVELIYGINHDPELGETIKVTVIATGFNTRNAGHAETTRQKIEFPDGFMMKYDHFKQLKEGREDRSRDNSYLGIRKTGGSFSSDLEIPTVLRIYPETDGNQTQKAAAGGKEA
jgi:cell division protein FtsZ